MRSMTESRTEQDKIEFDMLKDPATLSENLELIVAAGFYACEIFPQTQP